MTMMTTFLRKLVVRDSHRVSFKWCSFLSMWSELDGFKQGRWRAVSMWKPSKFPVNVNVRLCKKFLNSLDVKKCTSISQLHRVALLRNSEVYKATAQQNAAKLNGTIGKRREKGCGNCRKVRNHFGGLLLLCKCNEWPGNILNELNSTFIFLEKLTKYLSLSHVQAETKEKESRGSKSYFFSRVLGSEKTLQVQDIFSCVNGCCEIFHVKLSPPHSVEFDDCPSPSMQFTQELCRLLTTGGERDCLWWP